ncbi:MAG: hypothetical protein C0487_01920 [Leptothrix sp. (in: Bacteria)]|nr:hypothetical protein [Leptothrix sp. (in: b-proteobacteria)]
MTRKQSLAALMLAMVYSISAAQAPLVEVSDGWVRHAVKGQSGTGGFMTLTSRVPLTLVGFRSPVSASAELHEMSMQGDVMRMRAIDALPLPAGQPVALQPGGHHLMLMGLKRPLSVGDHLLLTLKLRDEKGRLVQQRVRLPVLATAPAGAASQPHH